MTYISADLRRVVLNRSGGCCEYCRLNQEYSDLTFRSGKTVENNLALSCARCNLYKGTNIASADPLTDEPTFLFHPRRHKWREHFRLTGAMIEPLTAEGRATAFVLRLNDQERIEERELLLKLDRYPCPDVD